MKINNHIYRSLIIIFIICCSFYSNKNTYQTECVSLDTDGYYTIKIWDTKKGDNYRSEDARKDAIHAFLYSGIAGANGCSSQKPILDKLEEQNNFKMIEKDFFAKKGKWSAFTRSSTREISMPLSFGQKECKVYQVSISKNALRQYLEEMKIIKSLNNQF